MPQILHEPPRELRRLATRIEAGLGIYIRARGHGALHSQWEAPRHGWALGNLAIRHTEATALMARTDVAMAPTAFVTARAAVESAARSIWLMEPEDVWEREARWVAFLREGGRLAERRQLAENERLSGRARAIRDFASEVGQKLPAGTEIPGIPSIDSLLARYGTTLDAFYVHSSQYTHSAELATSAFRVNLGIAADFGDYTDVEDWIVPLRQAWQAATARALQLMKIVGDKPGAELKRVEAQVAGAFEELAKSLGA